jgi:signal transduction histidine kinase
MGGIVRAVATDRKGSRVELAVKIRDEDRIFDFCVEPSATSVIVVGFDITARKLAEAKLRESDRRKDEFFATLSHEIRNPLAPLKIAIEVARIVGDDAEQRAESLAVMERQVGMLSELVDELLDLSRITQGKVRLDLQPFDIAEILDVAVQQARPLIDGASHELRLALPPHPIYVTCDRGRVVQVFGNLLVNAAKYTPAHGVIEVRVHADAANQRVTVQIRDTGIGISADALDTIFDIFVQSRDAEGRAQGGLGIGLNVVRRLVEMHGGVVTASSDGAGHGSAFTVELPIAPH